ARTALRGLDPFVFLEARVNDEVLIAHLARCRYFERPVGHVHDLLWLTDLPADGELLRWWQIGFVAFGRAGLDPAADEQLVAVAQARVVDEMAIFRIRVPGRHALLIDNFADHFGPTHDLVVAGERERGNLARPMALHAVVLQDAGDLLGIRYIAV